MTMRRWHVKDAQGEDLLDFWRRQPPHSNEVAAAEIIDELERELAGGILWVGARCGTCGFCYQQYKGHIIPCPRCALEAVQR